MISRVSRFMTTFVSKYLPDPLIFAVLLTFVTLIRGFFTTIASIAKTPA